MPGDHPSVRPETVLLVAVGGFAGANLRYVLAEALPGLAGTFGANVLGSLLLGFLVYEAVHTGLLGERTSLVFGTGFLSSFTTYSTFALEVTLAPTLVGVGYVAASYALGFAAVLVGRGGAAALSATLASASDGEASDR